jgi:outer membrane protein TolC
MRIVTPLAGVFALGLWALAPGRVPAQPAPASRTDTLVLATLIEEVRRANPELQAERLGAEALGMQRRQVTALPDPMFSVQYQPYPILTAYGTQRTQWRVEQQVPYPGKLGLQGRISGYSAEVAELEAEALAQDLILQVKLAYYTLYQVQEQEWLVARFQGQLREFEAVAVVRYEVGTGMQQAILKAQLERNSLAVRRQRLAEQRSAALEALARLLNRPDTAWVSGFVVVPAPSVPPAGGALVREALRQRPEAEALRRAREQADERVALARKAFWPDLTLSLTYFDIAAAEAPPTAGGRDAFMVGAGLRLPLGRGRLNAHLEETRLKRRRVEARYEALEVDIVTRVEGLLARLERQRHQLDLFRLTLLPQAQFTLEATLSAYTNGSIGFLDLLDAERMLFTLNMEDVETHVRYLQTTAQLARVLGVVDLP